MTEQPERMFIQDCSKCNGRLAGHVRPMFGNAAEYVRADLHDALAAENARLREALRHGIAQCDNFIAPVSKSAWVNAQSIVAQQIRAALSTPARP